MDAFRIGLLAPMVALFVWSAFRWMSTANSDPEKVPRRDTFLLLALGVAGLVGDLIRSQLPDRSIGFIVCSFALAPIAVGAVWILCRLIREYRRTHVAVPPSHR